MSDAILQAQNLAKNYQGVAAVRDISFTVDAGEVVALIGPNGAGKSTCFNMLSGQNPPTSGTIHIFGHETTRMRPRAIWRLGVGRTFQITATFTSMSVRENVAVALLSHHGRIWSLAGARDAALLREADALLDRVGMGEAAARPSSELAYGDLKRLELAVALANDPKLLLMDEPTAGMAPRERIELMRLTAEIARDKRIGVLFTEHDMDVVFEHADRVMVMDRGRIIAQGTPADVRADAHVRAVYLGEGALYDTRYAAALLMLSVANLESFYGRAQILFDVGLDVARGEVVALLGRNGAGKSTTFRSIMGLVPGRRGRIDFDGADMSAASTHAIVKRGLGYVPEDRRIFTDLTVDENLEVGRQPPRKDVPHWTPEILFALFPNLAAMRKRPGGRMSGGEQQMLTIARTLMGNPHLVLLDEPSEGLSPKIVEQMAAAILEMKGKGLGIVISEQNMHFAKLICDRAYIIEKGRIRFAGSMAELADNPELRDAYLAV